jgi:hypothetical protein
MRLTKFHKHLPCLRPVDFLLPFAIPKTSLVTRDRDFLRAAVGAGMRIRVIMPVLGLTMALSFVAVFSSH